MSNFRVDCDPDRNSKHSSECHPHDHRLMTKTILKCGHGTGASRLLLNRDDNHHEHHDSHDRRERRTIASVTLDTRKLIDPTVKIDFCSIISFETTNDHDFELRLVFRLIKICKEDFPIPLGEWIFERAQEHNEHDASGLKKCEEANEIEESNSFCFSWCECQEERDHCRFIVEIVDQEIHDVRASITNVTLTALAVGCEEM